MGSITSYGLFWRWELVELDNHRIYGWLPNNDGWANEPDHPSIEITKTAAVYALQNKDRQIVYVGKTSRLSDRLWAHTRNNKRGRWSHFTWFGLESPATPIDRQSEFTNRMPSKPTLEQEKLRDYQLSMTEIEALLITIIEPSLNKQSGQWNGRKEYLQFSDYEDVSNRDLWDRMKKSRIRKALKQ